MITQRLELLASNSVWIFAVINISECFTGVTGIEENIEELRTIEAIVNDK